MRKISEEERNAVIAVLAEEVRAKEENRPYREAVITACKVCLDVNGRKLYSGAPHYTVPKPQEEFTSHRLRYWWQDQD